jgi:Mn2+/Fe2+ NRAMP family transporter
MKKAFNVLLGVATSIGGFIEVGSLSTSAEAGAAYQFRLLWALAIAIACVAFLAEMSGRLAAVSGHTVAAAVRERFGFRFHALLLGGETLLDLLVLTAEVSGIAVAIHLLTAVGFQWWVLPVGLLVWLVLWKLSFDVVEHAMGLLGLVTVCFVVAAVRLDAPLAEIARGFLPSVPDKQPAHYGFLAVSILGATVSPYLLNFYASGAVEDKWKEGDLPMNRVIAGLGMGFGGVVSIAVLVVSALVLAPKGIRVDGYEQAALTLVPAFGSWGVPLFAASLGIGCFGAAVELALNLGYAYAQGLGWKWSKAAKPRDDARFSLVYTAVIAAATLIALVGVDPLRLTMLSMAVTVILMPLIVLPFLVVMNDPRYVGDHANGWIGNGVVVLVTIMGALLALLAVPLQILGGS